MGSWWHSGTRMFACYRNKSREDSSIGTQFETKSTPAVVSLGLRGAFHSTKNSDIFQTGTKGTEISRKKFQKILKLLNFRKANHLTENFGFSGMKIKWNGFTSIVPHLLTRLFMQILNFRFSACFSQRRRRVLSAST